jgi:hypothetical protein
MDHPERLCIVGPAGISSSNLGTMVRFNTRTRITSVSIDTLHLFLIDYNGGRFR